MDGNKFDSKDKGFLFASKDYREKLKILLIIHGSGVVRAGQWSRKLIINKSLDDGTQFPYIRKAEEEGFGVIVLNTNYNRDQNGDKIPSSEEPEKHGVNVWKNLVKNLNENTKVAIVAHSYGGYVVSVIILFRNNNAISKCFCSFQQTIADKHKDDFKQRVYAVALTDAIDHKIPHCLKGKAKNWITSEEPLGTKLEGRFRRNEIVEYVSAGTTAHEETSSRAIEQIFQFFQEKELEWTDQNK